MVNKVTTAAVIGLTSHKVDVETDVNNSLPGVAIVGLPDTAINEARDRIRAAIKNSGFTFPAKKVIVNLAPADLKKEGAHFDLPIAMGILSEEEVVQVPPDYAFIGELSLDGTIRGVNGVLPLVLGLKQAGVANVIVPAENAAEAALAQEVNVFGAQSLAQAVNHFIEAPISLTVVDINAYMSANDNTEYEYDFKDVKGQQKAKRALEIAAAGAHNLVMSGSPGSGKTLMAKCFASILPPLEIQEALELTKIYSICGLLATAGDSKSPLMTKRPFRSVHHKASANGIIGGGSTPKPGEITLAHRGVLFLDEMVEFARNVLETLRQPLEDGEIVISRTRHSVKYPAKFTLLGAMNPCPCGFLGDKEKHCTCSDYEIQRYRSKLSGPLLDRIDLSIEVPRLTSEELLNSGPTSESSAQIRARVVVARKTQAQRYANEKILTNSELTPKLIKKYCQIDPASEELLKSAAVKYKLSGRRYDRILKLARTIADLDGTPNIAQTHLMQALQYRVPETLNV